MHFDGTAMNVVAKLPWRPAWLRTVRARSSDDIWAIDQFGGLLHFDGNSSTYLNPGPWVYSVAIVARNDVWASSEDGLWHFDGNSWSKENAPRGMLAATGGAIYSLALGRICRKP